MYLIQRRAEVILALKRLIVECNRQKRPTRLLLANLRVLMADQQFDCLEEINNHESTIH